MMLITWVNLRKINKNLPIKPNTLFLDVYGKSIHGKTSISKTRWPIRRCLFESWFYIWHFWLLLSQNFWMRTRHYFEREKYNHVSHAYESLQIKISPCLESDSAPTVSFARSFAASFSANNLKADFCALKLKKIQKFLKNLFLSKI